MNNEQVPWLAASVSKPRMPNQSIVLSHEYLDKCVGQIVTVPVSMATRNRVFDRDKGFKGPFGLAEKSSVWRLSP